MSKGSSMGLDRLTRVAEEAMGEDPRAATFVRGLMLGALVGAAIAGSTIWQRRHGRSEALADPGRKSQRRS
jgi:hypothetical protein